MFDGALETSDSEVESSPYCRATLNWLRANADTTARNAITSFLLHPLIRSYQVRSILGRQLHEHVFRDLETIMLTQDGENIPEVIGVYALHAPYIRDPVSSNWPPDLTYVGQACGMMPDFAGAIAIRRRAKAYFRGILLGKQESRLTARRKRKRLPPTQYQDLDDTREKRLSWIYERLADDSLGPVRLAVLSTFPFPDPEMGDYYHHLQFLLCLAESIDMVFLGSLKNDHFSFLENKFAVWYGKSRRPKSMPTPTFEGLNRALPLKQGCHAFGTLGTSFLWSRSEIDTLVRIVQDHERDVYVYSPSRKIQWDVIASLCQKHGVDKDEAGIRRMHRILSNKHYPGFISHTLSKWRLIWNLLYSFKEHLERNSLVREPEDNNDLFFHIPALEEGCQTSYNIRQMFRRSECNKFDEAGFVDSFLPRYLPSLLHREVWTRISSKSCICDAIKVYAHRGDLAANDTRVS